jgi:hypothetical protein
MFTLTREPSIPLGRYTQFFGGQNTRSNVLCNRDKKDKVIKVDGNQKLKETPKYEVRERG